MVGRQLTLMMSDNDPYEVQKPRKVRSMEVYEELQNPALRLVLSNIP